MEWMDGARRAGGLAWVAVGLVLGVGWAVAGGIVPGVITLMTAAAVVGLAALVALPRTPPALVRTGGWVVAVVLAAAFAGAVADRFGLFGPPGAPGVSWGSWPAFVAYTGILLHGVPGPLAVVAAVGATVAEVALAVALAAGWRRRWVGKAAAGLLTVYLVAMAASVGWGDVARYALPLEVGGALLVTVCPPRRRDRAATPTGPAGQGTGSGRDDMSCSPTTRSRSSFSASGEPGAAE